MHAKAPIGSTPKRSSVLTDERPQFARWLEFGETPTPT
jgi:hypothetical protein